VLPGDNIAELAAFDLNADKAFAVVLVALELQDLGDAEARAEQHGQQGVVAQALLCAGAGPHAQRLRGVEQAELLQAGEPFPVGCGLRWRIHPLGGTAEGRQLGKFPVEPAGEVAHGGVDADQRGLGETLSPELFEKSFGDRDEPFLRAVVAAELVIEGEKAV
jgi:hypothetical protein